MDPPDVRSQPPPESKLKRTVGEWTAADIQTLAESMIEETQFVDVVHAGSALLDNLNGKPSFPSMSPLFMGDKLRIVTVNSATTSAGKRLPMISRIRPIDPRVTIALETKTPGYPNFPRISENTKLRFESLTIDATEMEGFSDFLFKLYIAKEIYNMEAFDMVSEYMVRPILENYKLTPDTDESKRALQLYGLRGGIAEMPASAMVDLWAHFILVPAYLTAEEQGRFTTRDLRNDGEAINIFKTPAQMFREDGILTKNEQGQWEWTKDYDQFSKSWEDVALTGYRAGVMS